MLLQTLSKNHIILWKKQWTTLKKTNHLEKSHPDFSKEGKEDGHVGVFCQNLGIKTYTSENYSNFENKFLFNNGSILKKNDYFNNRSRGNVSFTELSEIIATLSNQDFAELDKFRLLEKKNKCFYCKSIII